MSSDPFVGDLVIFDARHCDDNVSSSPWIVVEVTRTKKVWHRYFTLYRHDELLRLPWTRKDLIRTIQTQSER